MRVACLSPYPECGPSVRHRIYAYKGIWEEHGIYLTLFPFMTDRFYNIRRRFGWWWAIEKRLWFIICTLRLLIMTIPRLKKFEVVIVHREVFPLGPPFFEQFIARMIPRVIYDIDDAIWHSPSNKINQRGRWNDEHRVEKIVTVCCHVVAGNAYIETHVGSRAAVTVLPTSFDDLGGPRAHAAEHASAARPTVVAWIGNSGNAWYVRSVLTALESVAREHPCMLRLIGDRDIFDIESDVVPIDRRIWTEHEEQLLVEADVGIMPLPDLDYERGKSGFKIIQYWSAGLAVIASPVGVNASLVHDGVDGLLAKDDREWTDAFEAVISSANKRRSLAHAGYGKYVVEFNRRKNALRWIDLLRSTASIAAGRRSLLALAMLTSACLVQLGSGVVRAGEPEARITLSPQRPGPTVSRLLFGTNLQWENSGDESLIRGRDGDWTWAPNLITLLRKAGISFVRFPGGSLANTYRWRFGVGERRDRRPGVSFAGDERPSTFGTDEVIELSGRLNADIMLTANVSEGAASARDWIAYIEQKKGPAVGSGGGASDPHRPQVSYLEVGNELFSSREHGAMSAQDYGRAVSQYARYFHAENPKIKVGAMLEGSFQAAPWMPSRLPVLADWNEEVLRTAGRDVDFVSIHFGSPYDTLWRNNKLHQLVWSSSIVLERTLRTIEGQIDRYARPGTPIAVTEYTTFFGGDGIPDRRVSGTENALFDALVLFVAMRDTHVVAAANWSALNNANFGMLTSGASGGVEPRPNYAVFERLSSFAGKRTIPVEIISPSYGVDAKGNVPVIDAVPMLDAAAVRDDDASIHLCLVNRSVDQELAVVVGSTTGMVELLESSTLTPSASDGEAWTITPTVTTRTPHEKELRIVVPPSSFNDLHLRGG